MGSSAPRLPTAEYVDMERDRLKMLWVARRWCEMVYRAPPVLLAVLRQDSTIDGASHD